MVTQAKKEGDFHPSKCSCELCVISRKVEELMDGRTYNEILQILGNVIGQAGGTYIDAMMNETNAKDEFEATTLIMMEATMIGRGIIPSITHYYKMIKKHNLKTYKFIE